MNSYLPTLRQLQYLVALHDHGHFGKAADACCVTQSTLSSGLQELERLLGTRLVERSRRGIRFTSLGIRIVDRGRQLLRDAEEITGLARAAAEPLSGHLAMGVIPTIAPFLLPRLLPKLREAYPRLKLYLREETSGHACEALHRGRLDCAILALPFDCGDVESETLFSDRLLLALPRAAAETMPAEVQPSQIDPEQLLLLEDGHCLTDHALAVCGRGARGGAAVMGTTLHTLVQMVDNGLGMTLVPEMALDAGILSGTTLVAKPIDAPNSARKIALVWRRRAPNEKELRMLAGALRDAACTQSR
jgi:LysR family transcriptional regulator, hydrogen peroxide-inducible genes activator